MTLKIIYVENDYSPHRLRKEFKVENYDDLLKQILSSLKDNNGNKLSAAEQKVLTVDFFDNNYSSISNYNTMNNNLKNNDILVLSDIIYCPQNIEITNALAGGSAFTQLASQIKNNKNVNFLTGSGIRILDNSSTKSRYYEWL
jgi:mannose/fructose-specific phosphotransferase system component IIA